MGIRALILCCFVFITACDSSKKRDFKSKIQKSMTTHEQSKNYHDWLESEDHPQNYFKSLQSSESKDLCDELEKLEETKLAIFYNELIKSENLDCKEKLIQKIDDFMLKKSDEIKHTMPGASILDSAVEFGPSEERFIDTTGGPIFINGNLAEKEVALTFDDGPHGTLTPKLLKILKKENLQVSFFSVGKNVKQYPEIISDIIYDEHSLGNHSWSHPNMKKLPFNKSVDEIESTFEQINHETSFFIPFFRYPYGSYTQRLKVYLKSNNISAFFWNTDTLDWKYTDPAFLINYAWKELEKVKKGIILFHDVQPQTIAIMPEFIRRLKRAGYKPVVFRTKKERL